MNIALALEYIPRRMRELGHGNNYTIKYRHIVLTASETLSIEAGNDIYLLVEENSGITISSELGVYDLSDQGLNELIHEHQGSITITNNSKDQARVKLIQIVPQNQ